MDLTVLSQTPSLRPVVTLVRKSTLQSMGEVMEATYGYRMSSR